MGNALCIKQDYENAVGAYSLAISKDDNNAQAFYNLGNALYMMNKTQEAIRAYMASVEIN